MHQVVVDLQVQYPRSRKLPLSLTSISGTNTLATQPPILIFRDADNDLVFDTTVATHLGRRLWGDEFVIDRWNTDRLQLTVICRLVSPVAVPNQITFPAAIDPRACVATLDTVTSLRFYNNRTDSPVAAIGIDQAVHLRGGFNMAVVATPATKGRHDGSRSQSTITLGALAGEGQGAYKDCQGDAPFVRTLNLIPPDSVGNFQLSGDPCFRIEPVVVIAAGVATIVPGQLRISDDCSACCDCDDYLRVYRGIERIARELNLVGDRLDSVRNEYAAANAAMRSFLEESNSSLRLRIRRYGDCRVAAIVGQYNATSEPMLSPMVSLQILSSTDNANWVPATIAARSSSVTQFRQNRDVGSSTLNLVSPNNMQFSLGDIQPGETNSAMLTFRVVAGQAYINACASLPALSAPAHVCDTLPVLCE